MQRPAKPFTPVRFRPQPPYNMKQKYILVSGGFDPIHSGHINLINEASKIAKVIVILNSDSFLIKKKGYIFMNAVERKKVISSIKGVDDVFLSIDQDYTVIKSIDYLAKRNNISFFANGGDRKNIKDIPESEVCDKNNIKLLFDVGGEKSQSSSSLTSNFYDNMLMKDGNPDLVKKPWGFYKNIINTGGYILKKLYINANEELSEQLHNFRDEHWVIVSGQVEVLINAEIYVKEANDYIFIPKKTIHKVKNVGNEPAIILEVQTGVILSEEDIIRFKDKYNRS